MTHSFSNRLDDFANNILVWFVRLLIWCKYQVSSGNEINGTYFVKVISAVYFFHVSILNELWMFNFSGRYSVGYLKWILKRRKGKKANLNEILFNLLSHRRVLELSWILWWFCMTDLASVSFWAGRHWWIESVTMVRPIDFRKGILFTFWKHQWTEMDLVNYWIEKIFQSVWLRLIPVKNENVLPKI